MSVLSIDYSLSPHEKPRKENLWKRVALLAAPVVVEQVLHSIVQFTDTYIANNLIESSAAGALEANRQAGSAIGTVAYLIWFFGLIAGTIGVGSTALIARAVGAQHRSVANSVCGQAMIAAFVLGFVLGLLMWFGAGAIGKISGLPPEAIPNFTTYMRIMAPALPLTIVMFAAASCLRGAGDTLSTAVAFIVLDLTNALLSLGLTRGWGPLPNLGFAGIAVGTSIA
ncbi:MAG TPA: MATE family efflux transporter, partial [Tepidisphaeraceae bacterium]|nr:MATE family efflux transporter [Tepidisphaeraceae bacterium]